MWAFFACLQRTFERQLFFFFALRLSVLVDSVSNVPFSWCAAMTFILIPTIILERKTREACKKGQLVESRLGCELLNNILRHEQVTYFSYARKGRSGRWRVHRLSSFNPESETDFWFLQSAAVPPRGGLCPRVSEPLSRPLVGPQAHASLPSWVRIFSLTLTQPLGLLGNPTSSGCSRGGSTAEQNVSFFPGNIDEKDERRISERPLVRLRESN